MAESRLLGGDPLSTFVAALGAFAQDRALCFFADYTTGARHDLARGAKPSTVSGVWDFSALGGGTKTDATRNGLVYASPAALGANWAIATYVCIFRPTLDVTGTQLYVMAQGVNGDPAHSIIYDTTNLRFGILENALSWAANNSAPIGPTYTIVAVKDTFNHRLFVNGVLVVGDTNGQTATRPTGVLGIGRQGSSTSGYASGIIPCAMVFNRALSDNDAVQLSRQLMAAQGTANQRARYRRLPYVAATGGTGVTGSSSVAIALGGSSTGTVAIAGASALGLLLAGSASGTVSVQGASTQSVGLGGSAAGTVLVQGASSQSLGLAGSATGAIVVAATSNQPIALGGAAAGTVALVASSSQPLALGGAASGTVLVTGASSTSVGLSGSATGTVSSGVTGNSSLAIALAGSASGTVTVAGTSSQALSLGGTASGAVLVLATSSRSLGVAGSATGTVGNTITGSSSLALGLAGTASGTVRVAGSSTATLAIGGASAGTLLVAGASSLPITLGSVMSGAVLVRSTSSVALALLGFATGTVSDAVILVPLPLSPTSLTLADSRRSIFFASRSMALGLSPSRTSLSLE